MSFAVDEALKLKKCDFAVYGEDININIPDGRNEYMAKEADIFKQWDNSLQEGIFATIANNNLNLGEPSHYVYTYHTPSNAYFNEFTAPDDPPETTVLPVINSKNSPKYLYVKCNYTVGDKAVMIGSSGYTQYSYLTSDFKLTEGLLQEPDTNGHYYLGNPVSCAGNAFFYFHPARYLWNNSVKYERIGNGDQLLYPNTEAYQVLSSSLAEIGANPFPTSLLRLGFYFGRDVSDSNMVSSPGQIYFYVENNPPVDYLAPFLKQSLTIIDKDTGERYQTEGAGDTSFLFQRGHTYNITAEFRNVYTAGLSGLEVGSQVYSYTTQSDGCGVFLAHRKTNITSLNFYLLPRQMDIPVYGVKNLSWVFAIPAETEAICELLLTLRLKTRMGTYYTSSPKMGSDSESYLAFANIRQESTVIGGIPSFKVENFLNVPQAFNAPPISPDTYSIIAQALYTDKETGLTTPWGEPIETFLDAATISEITGGLGIIPKSLARTYPYSVTTTIPLEWDMPFGEYSIEFYTKALTGRFAGKTVAYMPPYAEFGAGSLQYPPSEAEGGAIFNFDINSRTAVKPVTLFNPDFNPHILALDIPYKSDDEHFRFTYRAAVGLKPLEAKAVNITVDALYEPWPEYSQLASFRLRASTDQPEIEPSELTYLLNVKGDYRLNLKAEELISNTTTVMEGEPIWANVTWSTAASGSAFDDFMSKNKPYSIKISLVNRTATKEEVAFEQPLPFTITANPQTRKFTAGFIPGDTLFIPAGTYSINFSVDPANKIVENLTLKVPKEDDNNLSIIVVVKDPDETQALCAEKFGVDLTSPPDYSLIACTEGQTGCWIPGYADADSVPADDTACCGDDNLDECWLNALGDGACCYSHIYGNVAYITDADFSKGYCNLLKTAPIGIAECELDAETYCWEEDSQQCCGDDAGETWTYSSSASLSEILVGETCCNGEWHAKKSGFYYGLTVEQAQDET